MVSSSIGYWGVGVGGSLPPTDSQSCTGPWSLFPSKMARLKSLVGGAHRNVRGRKCCHRGRGSLAGSKGPEEGSRPARASELCPCPAVGWRGHSGGES